MTTTANGEIRFRQVAPTFRHTKHLAAFCRNGKAKGESEADKLAAFCMRARVYAKADNRQALTACIDSLVLRYNLLINLEIDGKASASDRALCTLYGATVSYLRSL